MALNNTPPYLLYNVFNKKDREFFNQIVPQLKKRLEEKYQTEVTISKDFVINYDPEKLSKDKVMRENSQVIKDYLNKNKG